MQLKNNIISFLKDKRTFYGLLFLTIGAILVLFSLNITSLVGDEYMYVFIAKALHQGKYTHWIIIDEYIPDTFRNPGYAFFIYLIQFISEWVILIKIVQVGLLLLSIYLFLGIIDYYNKSIHLKNIFLLLLNINFVILAYPGYVFPETMMTFLITLIINIELTWKENTWKKTLLLVILYSYAFQVRPVILFIPFIRFFYLIYKNKMHNIAHNLVFVILFIVSMLPYGYWNFKTHGVFKVTSLEGGAGVMYLGYWSPKMVDFTETNYWRNATPKDVLINFSNEKESLENRIKFNQEWDSITNVCNKYLTKKDLDHLAFMKKNDHLFVTYNGKYTTEREKILKKVAVHHLLNDWQYTIKLKAYTFFRLWYTGLNVNDLNSNDKLNKYSSILAFLTTFSTLLLSISYFIYCLFKRRDILITLALPIALCLYFDVLHLPFAIQSRYTICVRMFYLFILAYMIYELHFKNKDAQININNAEE